jgi:hypothetical protein
VYRDSRLIRLVSAIAGWEAVEVRDPLERHVIHILHQRGDTHGAHTDDYPLALVLFTEAPDEAADGGLLEHVPHATGLDSLTTGSLPAWPLTGPVTAICCAATSPPTA